MIFIERKASNSGLDQLRRRATDMGSLTRRGSLERRSADKRRSWSPDNFATNLETFRPITLTVSSFFKQVGHFKLSINLFFTTFFFLGK